MFKKILIANRGEIACRVIRTAKKLGIKTVAVYSEADAQALHVKMADEAYLIGPAPTSESYLQGAKIIQTALNSGAEAIHPGYGFLAENADFAENCIDAGICFIGPSPAAIRAMGGKSAAKQRMEQAKVPVIPGYHGDNQDPKHLHKVADSIGYPVLIKAVAGGGGKGMREVHESKMFIEALNSAKREAKASFGDDRVLLEKYLTRPRHVEVQVFADAHNHALYLFERDCSIQRRHQKIIEEAPAPGMTEELRQQMGSAAVTAAKAINYLGAGTIEFLLDEDGSFYFMEMNTRLQVEHPVTEMITGLDLVEWQLRIAAGEPLPITEQQQLKISGHAFEARIYAEDPTKDFMPSIGKLIYLKIPTENKQVRIDSGVRQGDTISIYYDPLIAKLIVWDYDRNAALFRLRQALEAFQVVGVATNIDLLQAIANHPAFAHAELDTNFIAKHHDVLLQKPLEASVKTVAIAALSLLLLQQKANKKLAQSSPDPHSPWFSSDNWRPNLSAAQKLTLLDHDHERTIIAHSLDQQGYRMEIAGSEYNVNGQLFDAGELSAYVNGEHMTATAILTEQQLHLFFQGHHYHFMLGKGLLEEDKYAEGANHLIAPMPGTIVNISINSGQKVNKGDILLVIEAMKMEHTIYAPANGVIKEVYYNVGDLINEGEELLSFEALD